ncbi:hypothetical protein RF11_16307 [Thelohanellus kitauei]|uniref:Uncharacterized protein n=1 Tax=Thelohanellus kitauei TaxID=669202 RepID=A0A0C2N1W0_THEKT|nr:hypothetical protein RF11_16307 [Thelohanellus kitauei]
MYWIINFVLFHLSQSQLKLGPYGQDPAYEIDLKFIMELEIDQGEYTIPITSKMLKKTEHFASETVYTFSWEKTFDIELCLFHYNYIAPENRLHLTAIMFKIKSFDTEDLLATFEYDKLWLKKRGKYFQIPNNVKFNRIESNKNNLKVEVLYATLTITDTKEILTLEKENQPSENGDGGLFSKVRTKTTDGWFIFMVLLIAIFLVAYFFKKAKLFFRTQRIVLSNLSATYSNLTGELVTNIPQSSK